MDTTGLAQSVGQSAIEAAVGSVMQCPNCHGSLRIAPHSLQCSRCDRTWRVEGGVPRFGGTDYRSHRLASEQRHSIAEATATDGWQSALHDRLRSISLKEYRQAIDEYRAQWRFVLPLTPASRVLDLSCGWGVVSLNLAESCALVVGADACWAQARFAALRAQQTSQDRLAILHLGLDESLPFAPGSFDTAVLIDALAWLPDGKAQRTLLCQVRASLRPGGALFLAEKNHLGAPSIGKSDARCSARSIEGYRRLLKSAGFGRLRLYAPIPSHMEPFFFIPFDQTAALAYFLKEILASQDFEAHSKQQGHGALYRLARLVSRRTPASWLARVVKPFVPSIAILAEV